MKTDMVGAYKGQGTSLYYEDFVVGMTESGAASVTSDPELMSIDAAEAFRAPIDVVIDGKNYKGMFEVVFSGSDMYFVEFCVPEAMYDEKKATVEETLDTISLAKPKSPAAAENSSSEQKNSSSAATETLSQKNAVAKAKSYLNYTAFSYAGLIEQLEYEQFSHEDAVYGADHCGANWNEQAAKKAESYLKYSSFSRDGLIDQLLYEGFTQEEAEYGVSSVGF